MKGRMQFAPTQTDDVIANPRNPVNPDSKLQVKRVNITMKHFGMVSLTVVCDCSVNREICLYHENDVKLILEILKILIQNQVKAYEYYIGTCRGEDASIASLQGGIPTGQKGLIMARRPTSHRGIAPPSS